jgi:hypothetical protein
LLSSGEILLTSMRGAEVTTCSHHSILLAFASWMLSSLAPEGVLSSVQVESSRRMGWGNVPCRYTVSAQR